VTGQRCLYKYNPKVKKIQKKLHHPEFHVSACKLLVKLCDLLSASCVCGMNKIKQVTSAQYCVVWTITNGRPSNTQNAMMFLIKSLLLAESIGL